MNRELKRIDSLYKTILENKKVVLGEADISGIDELVYNPATKKGGTIGFGFDRGRKVDGITWGNHDNHLHIGFTNREVAMDVIDKAHEMGLRTTENPYAKRDPNGKPPVGAGVDISGNKDTITELMKWVIQKYSGGNYTVDQTTDSGSESSSDSEDSSDQSKEDSKDKGSYGGKGSSFGSDPELFKAALGIGKMLGLNEAFGKNVSGRYGTLSIPGSSNSVILSPVDGKINNMKCGITQPTVKDGDIVSEGQVIGRMKKEDNVEVLMLNRSYHRKDLNTKEFDKSYSEKKSKRKKTEYVDDKEGEIETKTNRRSYTDPAMASLLLAPFEIFKDRYDKKTGELKQKRWAETGAKRQTDPWVLDAIKAPFKKVGKMFSKNKNEQFDRIQEDIEKIKRLIK